MNDQTVL